MTQLVRTGRAITAADAHTDSRLTDFATSYKNEAFIADAIAPVVLVDKPSDKYTTRSRIDVNTTTLDKIGPRGRSNEVSYDVSTGTYLCEDRGLHGVVPKKLLATADAPIEPDEWATANVMRKLMLNREKRVADLVMTQANWASGQYATMGAYWSNETSGTPLSDINTGLEAIPSDGDDSDLIFVCSLPVWNALRKHPQMLGLRGGGRQEGGQLGMEEFAQYIGVDRVFVSNMRYSTTNEGQTASYSRIWSSTKAALVKVPRVIAGADLELFCCTFRQKSAALENVTEDNRGIVTRKWHDPSQGIGGSDIVQVEFSDDEKVVQNDMGYLFEGVLA